MDKRTDRPGAGVKMEKLVPLIVFINTRIRLKRQQNLINQLKINSQKLGSLSSIFWGLCPNPNVTPSGTGTFSGDDS